MEAPFKSSVEFIEKNAYVALGLCAFALFLPEQPATTIHIEEIRKQYGGWIWLAMVLSGLFCVSGFWKYINKKIDTVFTDRAARKAEEKQKAEHIEKIEARLRSLNLEELLVVQYALHRNAQSFTSQIGVACVESLVNKKIAMRGSGHALGLPFHFTDVAWKYLQEHSDEFLTEQLGHVQLKRAQNLLLPPW